MLAEYLPDFAATGRLEHLSLPTLIAYLLERKLTGALHLAADHTPTWIFFSQGFPSGTALSDLPDYLGSILKELGFIDEAIYNDSLMEIANSSHSLGHVLVEKKKITAEQLERAVAIQLARALTRLFTLKTGMFSFVEDEEPPPPFTPIRINPYALMYHGIRNNYGDDDLKKGLEKLNGKSCRLSRLFIERKEFFGFPPEEARDLELLREFRLPQEYVQYVQSGPTVGMMLLLTLLSCGMIELEEVSFAQAFSVDSDQADTTHLPDPGASITAPPLPARPAPPAQPIAAARKIAFRGAPTSGSAAGVALALRRKVKEKYEQIKVADLWGILEIEKNADSEKIKKSYMTLAKVYHPDRVMEANDGELTHRMKVIFEQISEAFQTLSNPEKRIALAKETATGSEKRPSARPEEANLQFQKAMVYLKKHDVATAAECIRWALELDPNNGEYQAYRYWIDYLKGTEPEAERIGKVKANLLDVAKHFPSCFAAVRFLSLIYNKLKDQTNYEQFLLLAQNINPKDIDVNREVRLLTMRKEQVKGKGFFGRAKK
jgi:DnaJ-class molecular chaperone with C-terminal Zn finger domain